MFGDTRPETNESPHSNEVECAVLGAVLIDANTWPTVSHLTAEDFYRADHRAIYAACLALDEAGEPMDVVTVAERLEQDGSLEAAGGLAGWRMSRSLPKTRQARRTRAPMPASFASGRIGAAP